MILNLYILWRFVIDDYLKKIEGKIVNFVLMLFLKNSNNYIGSFSSNSTIKSAIVYYFKLAYLYDKC